MRKPVKKLNKEARKPGIISSWDRNPGLNRQGAKTAKGETGKNIFNHEINEIKLISQN